jgi:SOS-response transcriptional repressor LexA
MLEDDGAIERRQGAPDVKLLKPSAIGLQTRAVPIVGQVPGGPPMLAEENVTGWIRLPKSVAAPSSDKFFLLHVRGTSMNRASVPGGHIDDGDLVLGRQQANARNGDVVVALIDGEAIVKRLAVEPGYLVLKPESSDRGHRPILAEDDFRVLGKVTRVLKKGSETLRRNSWRITGRVIAMAQPKQHHVDFIATKMVKEPTEVIFTTKDGKLVDFVARL